MRLVLASASPRRVELLRAAGLTFDVVPADVDEGVRPDEPPGDYVLRVAREKAAAVSGQFPERPVLAADTTVVVDGLILGKPLDGEDAARMLRLLSGRLHEVITGVAVRWGARDVAVAERSTVAFAPLTDADIAWYVGTGEPLGKAGGYAIQGQASKFCRLADGPYDNVVGLPVDQVRRLLRELGFSAVEAGGAGH